jgi:cation:H+ antiporter
LKRFNPKIIRKIKKADDIVKEKEEDMEIILSIILLFIGLALVWKGSDWVTDSLMPVAKRLGTSYIAVTTLIVSLMLSIPEIFASVYSFFLGHPTLGLGIIIGSVMANIGLTVGISAIIRPLMIEESIVIRDGIFLVCAAGIVLLFGADLTYTRTEGFVLFLLFIPYALNVWFFEKHKPQSHKLGKVKRMQTNLDLIGGFSKLKLKASVLTFFIGTGLLLFGAYLFSFSLIEINLILKFPELIVGLTVGALGPALPNISAAIAGTRKGLKDAAISETFGSNIFTLLITLGIIISLAPLKISPKVFYFDLTWMIVMHVLMIAFILKGYWTKEPSLTRFEGVTLLLFYLALLVMSVLRF